MKVAGGTAASGGGDNIRASQYKEDEDAVIFGDLQKRRPTNMFGSMSWNSGWKTRYCVLLVSRVFCWKDSNTREIIGAVNVSNAKVEGKAALGHGDDMSYRTFRIIPYSGLGKAMELKATSSNQAREWILALQKAAKGVVGKSVERNITRESFSTIEVPLEQSNDTLKKAQENFDVAAEVLLPGEGEDEPPSPPPPPPPPPPSTQESPSVEAASVAANSSASENDIPEKFCCAITCKLMIDPVVTADGHTYERYAIERWFESRDTSPITEEPLESKRLIPNTPLRTQIQEFVAANPHLTVLTDEDHSIDDHNQFDDVIAASDDLTLHVRDENTKKVLNEEMMFDEGGGKKLVPVSHQEDHLENAWNQTTKESLAIDSIIDTEERLVVGIKSEDVVYLKARVKEFEGWQSTLGTVNSLDFKSLETLSSIDAVTLSKLVDVHEMAEVEKEALNEVLAHPIKREYFLNFVVKVNSILSACSVLFSELVDGASFSLTDEVAKLKKGIKSTADFKNAMSSICWCKTLGAGLKFVKKQFTAIPFGDAACSLIGYFLEHEDKRQQSLKMERGAMFDTMVSVLNGGNSKVVYTRSAVLLANLHFTEEEEIETRDNIWRAERNETSDMNKDFSWKKEVMQLMGISNHTSKSEEMASEDAALLMRAIFQGDIYGDMPDISNSIVIAVHGVDVKTTNHSSVILACNKSPPSSVYVSRQLSTVSSSYRDAVEQSSEESFTKSIINESGGGGGKEEFQFLDECLTLGSSSDLAYAKQALMMLGFESEADLKGEETGDILTTQELKEALVASGAGMRAAGISTKLRKQLQQRFEWGSSSGTFKEINREGQGKNKKKAASQEQMLQLQREIDILKKKLPSNTPTQTVSSGSQAMAMVDAKPDAITAQTTVIALQRHVAELESRINHLAIGQCDIQDMADNFDQRLNKQETKNFNSIEIKRYKK